MNLMFNYFIILVLVIGCTVAMHNPERWGLLQFSSSPKDAWPAAPVRYAEWPSRSAAMAVYAAQHACLDATGAFAPSAAALVPFSTPPFELCPGADVAIELTDDQGGFTATVASPDGTPVSAAVTTDRLLTVAWATVD